MTSGRAFPKGLDIGPAPDREIFLALVETLEQFGISYCLLSGYEGYPDQIPSDVDFMVRLEDQARLPSLMQEVAARSGSRLIQALRHETTACYYVLAKVVDGRVTYLQPDPSSDYRRNGRLWLRAEQMLAGRRLHPNGFYVPAPEDAFTYYLIKRVDKRDLSNEHWRRLAAWFEEAPEACLARVRTLWQGAMAQVVEQALRNGEWDSVQVHLGALAEALHQGAPRERWADRLRQFLGNTRRITERITAPTGLFVAFLGPDGSGKSTVIEQVRKGLAPAFRNTYTFHLRPRLGQRAMGGDGQAVTAPHGEVPRGMVASLGKLAYFVLDYGLGYWASLRPLLIRSTLVISDRYYHDLIIDPRRFRYGAPLGVAWMVGWLVPHPNVWVLLDAPVEVLQARKQEVSFDETARQREAYKKLVQGLEHAVVVDASQSVERVVTDVLQQLMGELERRTTKRLNLLPWGNVNTLSETELLSPTSEGRATHVPCPTLRPRYLLPVAIPGNTAIRFFLPGRARLNLALRDFASKLRQGNRVGYVETDLMRRVKVWAGTPDAQATVSLGTPGPYNKVTVVLEEPGCGPKAVAKVASTPAATALLKYEASWLERLSHTHLASHVPPLMTTQAIPGGFVLIEGPGFGRMPMPRDTQVLDFIAMLQAELPEWPDYTGSTMQGRMQDRSNQLAPLLSETWRSRIEKAMVRLEQALAGEALPMVAAHRDFSAWNIRLSAIGIFVFDWEYAADGYVPFYDWFHFRLMPLALRRAISPRHLRSLLAEAAALRRGPADDARKMRHLDLQLLAYMTDLCLFYLESNTGRHQGDRVVQRYGALLDQFEAWRLR